MQQRWCVVLSGVVQGIGLRPFLHCLSEKHGLTGWVNNTEHNVTLEWQGSYIALQKALDELHSRLSELGKLHFTKHIKPLLEETQFAIAPSTGNGALHTLIAPDSAACHHCLRELWDVNNRRYQYPFITCAHCGPRYTICQQLPYDRKNTTMSRFVMCEACHDEYSHPHDRRFHAQTISCWTCGPKLWLCDSQHQTLATQQGAINATITALLKGNIVAVKGIGGFHLMVLASCTDAVNELRKRKHRPDKPFALMLKNLNEAMKIAELSQTEQTALRSSASPIVIVKKKKSMISVISESVAPNQSHYGIMLAYAPLHHLLMSTLPSAALVATSANVKNEPLCYDNDEALHSLQGIADYWLMHDREIIHPLDDSIVHSVNKTIHYIRRARGATPFALAAPLTQQSYLAIGGHLKNTVALYHHANIYVSPYIGDLTSLKSVARFKREINHFLNLSPHPLFIGDNHHDYASHHVMQPLQSVQHHHAHIFAVMAEHQLSVPVLGFAWDGIGLGEDGFWGGETFLIDANQIAHVATLAHFSLPGGEKAITEPRRIALSLLYGLNKASYWDSTCPPLSDYFTPYEKNILTSMLQIPEHALQCSSMGRLFDGISFLLGGPPKMSFEGQGAMYLEQLASMASPQHEYPVAFIDAQNKRIVDWRPMLQAVLNDLNKNLPKDSIAQQFHRWCAKVICKIVSQFACKQIVLSGGVFQNKVLTEMTCDDLYNLGYTVYCAEQLPPNDSGLSVGQAYVFRYTRKNHCD